MKLRFIWESSDPVAKGVDIHAGAYGGKEDDIPGKQLVSRDRCLPYHIEKCGDRCHGTVAQLPDIHRHNTVRNLLAAKKTIKGLYDSGVHFFICLVKENLFDLVRLDLAGIQTGFHRGGNGPESELVHLAALHFQIPGV